MKQIDARTFLSGVSQCAMGASVVAASGPTDHVCADLPTILGVMIARPCNRCHRWHGRVYYLFSWL